MSRLLDLPKELILEILCCLWLRDLEGVASTCGRLRDLSYSLLKEHRSLNRRYCTLNGRKRGTIAAVLNEVLMNPSCGMYVKKVIVPPIHFLPYDMPAPPEYPAGQLTRLVHAVLDSGICQTLSMGRFDQEKWTATVEQGNESFLLAALLPLLPKLMELEFGQSSDPYSWVTRIVAEIQRTLPLPLSSLRRVTLLPFPGHNWYSADLGPYLSLPLLEYLSIPSYGTGTHFVINCDSNITNLELEDCTRNPKGLLPHFKSLQVFSFSRNKLYNYSREWDLLSFSTALRGSKRTLQRLKLLLRPASPEFLGSYHDYKVLSYMELDSRAMISDQGPSSTNSEAPLLSTLPGSLKELVIEDNTSHNQSLLQVLIMGVVRRESQSCSCGCRGIDLGKLSITVQYWPAARGRCWQRIRHQLWRRECSRAGIILHLEPYIRQFSRRYPWASFH